MTSDFASFQRTAGWFWRGIQISDSYGKMTLKYSLEM